METKYYTIKYNNGNAHKLDDFVDLHTAIDSAMKLHNPDWPCWEGIRIKSTKTHKTIFDTNKGRQENDTVSR